MKGLLFLLLTACLAAACAAAPADIPPTAAPTSDRVDVVPAQLAAIRAVSLKTGVPVDQVRLVSTEGVYWPDSCLGAPSAEVACAAVITPGFRIVLEAGGAVYRYHTNQDGRTVVEAPAEARLTWHREGGLAGFCDVLSVTTTGEAQAGQCNAEPRAGQLTEAELAQLRQWAQAYGAVVVVIGDPGVADSMLMSLEFSGLGKSQPDEAGQQALLDWAQAVYTRLTQP